MAAVSPWVYYECMDNADGGRLHLFLPMPRSLGVTSVTRDIPWSDEMRDLAIHVYDIVCPVILEALEQRDDEKSERLSGMGPQEED